MTSFEKSPATDPFHYIGPDGKGMTAEQVLIAVTQQMPTIGSIEPQIANVTSAAPVVAMEVPVATVEPAPAPVTNNSIRDRVERQQIDVRKWGRRLVTAAIITSPIWGPITASTAISDKPGIDFTLENPKNGGCKIIHEIPYFGSKMVGDCHD